MSPSSRHTSPRESAAARRSGDQVRVSSRTDVQWGRRIFRAPPLTMVSQIVSEVPFWVHCDLRSPRQS